MKRIGQTFLVAALMAWAGTAMANPTPFEYDNSCGKDVPNPSAGCAATQAAYKLTSSTSGLFPLVVGFDRVAQVTFTKPTFTCPDSNSFSGGSVDIQCGNPDPTGAFIPDGKLPILASKGQLIIKKAPLNGDAEFEKEAADLAAYVTQLATYADSNGQTILNVMVDPNPHNILYPPVFGPDYFPPNPVCVGSTTDFCYILNHVDTLVKALNANGNTAKYQKEGGANYVKFNGNPEAASQQILNNLALMKISVVKGPLLSACATAVENDPNNVKNIVGAVQALLHKLSPYMQDQQWCVTAAPAPEGYVTCEGTKHATTITPAPAKPDTLMITTASEDGNLDAVLAKQNTTLAAVKTTMACYEEVLKDQGKDIYYKTGKPVQAADSGNDDSVAVSDLCKSNVSDGYDCAKMVRVSSGAKTANKSEPGSIQSFIINGGRFNQMVWLSFDGGDGGGFALFDPMDVKRVMVCNNTVMMGVGRAADGSDQRDIIFSAGANDVFSASISTLPATDVVGLLKKVFDAHAIPTSDLFKDKFAPKSCDLVEDFKAAGAKDGSFVPYDLLPATTNAIVGVATLDGKTVLAYGDKTKAGTTLKGFGILGEKAPDYRALPAGIPVNKPRMVTRGLTDGIAVTAFDDNKSTKVKVAVRCVLPDAGGINCDKPNATDAEFNVIKGVALVEKFYDSAKVEVNDKDLSSQLLYMLFQPLNAQGYYQDLMSAKDAPDQTKTYEAALKVATNLDTSTLDDVVSATQFSKYGYKDINGAVIVTPMSTMVMRKADHGLLAQVVGALPSAETCARVAVDKISPMGFFCAGSGGVFSVPVVNLPPKCDGGSTAKEDRGVKLSPSCVFQVGEEAKDDSYSWKLEQKVGDNWVDVSSAIEDRTLQTPVAIMPNEHLTPMGSGKSAVSGSADATNFALFKATGTVANVGGAKGDAVIYFSASVPSGAAIAPSGTVPSGTVPATIVSAVGGLDILGGCALVQNTIPVVPAALLGLLLMPFAIFIPVRVAVRSRRK